MKLTMLGCGTSSGVPTITGHWGVCDPANPKNRRRRVSVLVEEGDTALLVDATPDLREQCLSAGIRRLDAVLITHAHADHCHGIDDLRGLVQAMGRRLPVHADPATLAVLKHRFGYIFEGRGGYPAICDGVEVSGPFAVGPIPVIPIPQIHGDITSYGFRFGSLAYSTDLNDLTDEAFALLEDVELWIVDALRLLPHPSHAHLAKTLEWIARVKPRRAVLTHMTGDMDYETLRRTLPAGVEPGYDGLEIIL